MEAILKNNPDLDLHTKGQRFGHFYLAILHHRFEIVKLFINYPGVDLNKKIIEYGCTVLWKAISGRDVEILNLLPRDKRAKYLPDHRGTSPLNLPCVLGRVEHTKWVLYFRGREIGDKEVKTLIKVATEENHIEIASLLQIFNQNREREISAECGAGAARKLSSLVCRSGVRGGRAAEAERKIPQAKHQTQTEVLQNGPAASH